MVWCVSVYVCVRVHVMETELMHLEVTLCMFVRIFPPLCMCIEGRNYAIITNDCTAIVVGQLNSISILAVSQSLSLIISNNSRITQF